ncbi:MAG: suppressor of fused domain protein [Spirochaetota bacterium]
MATENFTIVYQETNPYSSMTAYLEDDGRTVYLYLQSQHNPEDSMKSVWVKNRIEAPKERLAEDLQSGLAPLLCADEITASMDTSAILAEELYFIWLEEGNGLALFVREELYALLPPWSGVKGFHGYAKYAKKETITAKPLGDSYHGPIANRIEAARKFWEARSQKDSWTQIRDSRLDFLETKWGKHTKYWSADGGSFPYIGIASFHPPGLENTAIFTTVGMSGQNMPGVELYQKDYLSSARIELVFAVHYPPNSDKSETWVPHYLGDIVKFPWNMQKWLGNGHTIALNRRDPNSIALNYTNVFLLEKPNASQILGKQIPPYPLEGLESGNGHDVKFLYMLPISEEERHHLSSLGSDSFLERVASQGFGWLHNSTRESLV